MNDAIVRRSRSSQPRRPLPLLARAPITARPSRPPSESAPLPQSPRWKRCDRRRLRPTPPPAPAASVSLSPPFRTATRSRPACQCPQDEIAGDDVTFCWCPIEEAIAEAGPLSRRVLLEMQGHLGRKKRFVYIDSKIQWFQAGDTPVDSRHWHVDGSIAVRDERVRALGHRLLHDMRAPGCRGHGAADLSGVSVVHALRDPVCDGEGVAGDARLDPDFDDAAACRRWLPCESQPARLNCRRRSVPCTARSPPRPRASRLWIRQRERSRGPAKPRRSTATHGVSPFRPATGVGFQGAARCVGQAALDDLRCGPASRMYFVGTQAAAAGEQDRRRRSRAQAR